MDQLMCSLKYNKDNQLLIGASTLTYRLWDGSVYLIENDINMNENEWFTKNYSSYRCYNVNSGVSDVCWCNKESFLIGSDEGDITIARFNQSKEDVSLLMRRREHDSTINCLDSVYESNIAISGSQDSFIKIWNLETQMSLHTYRAHNNGVVSLTFNPNDSQSFVSCSQDCSVLTWDQRQKKPATKLGYYNFGYPSSSSWSELLPYTIVIGSEDGFLCLYDTRKTNEQIFEIALHERMITKVQFKKRYIATSSDDCKTMVLILSNDHKVFNKIYENNDHKDLIKSLSWAYTENLEYVTCSWDGLIKKHYITDKNN